MPPCLKLLADPCTRWNYLPHILRRILGDMKTHRLKIVQQIYGAMLFLKENRRHLLEVRSPATALSQVRPGSA